MNAGVLVFNSLGAAFQALHLAGLRDDVEVIELIPLGTKAQLLLKGGADSLKSLMQQVSIADIETVTLLPNWNQRVERAFYSLEHATPQGSLLFVESGSLGSLFEIAHRALQQELQIVDLKIPRGSNASGILILTASRITDQFIESLKNLGVQTTRVNEPSPALRKYFAIEA